MAIFVSMLRAETITLNFNSLPSAQGWRYAAGYGAGTPAETNAFSVDGTKLLQNTMGAGNNYAGYVLTNLIATNAPFTISVRARVLQSEVTQPGAPATAFIVYAGTGTESFGFGLNITTIDAPYGSATFHSIDATQFHDYRIEAEPGVRVRIFADDVLLIDRAPPRNSAPNVLGFGNASSFENGRAEVTRFVFSQRRGPTVSTAVSCVDVCWDSLSNRVYQVQYRSDLTTNQWTNLGSPIPGDGETKCISAPVLKEPARFYRVVESE